MESRVCLGGWAMQSAYSSPTPTLWAYLPLHLHELSVYINNSGQDNIPQILDLPLVYIFSDFSHKLMRSGCKKRK